MDDNDGRKLSILLLLEPLPLLGGGNGGGCSPILCRFIEVEEPLEGGGLGLSFDNLRLPLIASCSGSNSSAVDSRSVDDRLLADELCRLIGGGGGGGGGGIDVAFCCST